MKIKDGFVKRTIGNQTVVVATGDLFEKFNGMIKLNSTGTAIWNGIENGLDENQIAQKLSEEYDVKFEEALKDVKQMAAEMISAGIIE